MAIGASPSAGTVPAPAGPYRGGRSRSSPGFWLPAILVNVGRTSTAASESDGLGNGMLQQNRRTGTARRRGTPPAASSLLR